MQLNFTKMQGSGNDFVVVNGFLAPVFLAPEQIKKIANRTFGVGCDQLLMVEKSSLPDVDFKYRIFNADGNEVEQCGNGARCFVRFVVEKGLTTKHEITVETAGGIITLQLLANNQVSVNMGAPRFNPAEIPFIANEPKKLYSLDLGSGSVGLKNSPSQTLQISAVSMGNPHAVLVVDDVDDTDVASLGPQIESHERFTQRVNAGFMQVIDFHHIKLRVFERGSGETLSCGTGACAAVVSGIKLGLLQSPVTVNTRGGQLNIAWAGNNNAVMMTGPAEIVFEGCIEL